MYEFLPDGQDSFYCIGHITREDDTRCTSIAIARVALADAHIANWNAVGQWFAARYRKVATDGSSIYMTYFEPSNSENLLVRLTQDGRWQTVYDVKKFGPGAILVDDESNWVLAANVDSNVTKIMHFKQGDAPEYRVPVHLNRLARYGPDRLLGTCNTGLVMMYDGKHWIEIGDTPTDANLVAIHVAAPDEVWFGGWKSTVLRWDGKDRWKLWTLPGTQGIYSIVNYKDAIVAGADEGIFRLEGESFVKLTEIGGGGLMVHGDLLIACGGTNSISIYDGSTWHTETLEFEPRYTAELEAFYQDWEKKYGNIW